MKSKLSHLDYPYYHISNMHVEEMKGCYVLSGSIWCVRNHRVIDIEPLFWACHSCFAGNSLKLYPIFINIEDKIFLNISKGVASNNFYHHKYLKQVRIKFQNFCSMIRILRVWLIMQYLKP